MPKGKYNYRSYNDDFVTQVAKEIKRGDFIQTVCEKHGLSFSTCKKWADQLKLVVKKAPRKSLHNWEEIKKRLG